jgi:hypothetical protein
MQWTNPISIENCRPQLFATLTLAMLVAGCAASDVSEFSEGIFKYYEIDTNLTQRQTVMPGFYLDGDTAEIAVIHIDENKRRLLRMYGFNGNGWESMLEATLGADVLFVDMANIGGRDRLVSYENGRINWFDPDSVTEQPLVAVTSSFNPLRKDEIPHVDITQDVNGDGRDDLVVPDVDGFWVLVQTSDGAFADPVLIGPGTDLSRIYGADGYRYDPWSQSRVHQIDYNHDGQRDLVFWRDDHFEVHTQNEQGQFDAEPTMFTTEVAFDSADLSSLASGDMTGRVLHSLTDLNGDRVADLVVFVLEGSSIRSKHSNYEVHYGKPTQDGGTLFAPGVDIVFRSEGKPIVFQKMSAKGDYRQWVDRAPPQVPMSTATQALPDWPYVQLGMDKQDFDGDGQLDLMFTTIEVDFLTSSTWKRWKTFMGDSVWLNHEFYRMEGGRYSNTPNAIRRLALVGGPSAPGWVPLDLLLRGGTHESLKTQVRTITLEGSGMSVIEDWRRLSKVSSNSYPPAFNKALLIGDVTGDGRSDLLVVDHPWILYVFTGVPEPYLFARQPEEVAVAVPDDAEYTWLVDLNKDGKQDVLMHHPFIQRDEAGRRIQPPGTEGHRLMTLIAR